MLQERDPSRPDPLDIIFGVLVPQVFDITSLGLPPVLDGGVLRVRG